MPPRSDEIPKSESQSPDRDSGPREAAVFVAETLVQLMAICERHRLNTLRYFLGMAHMEANDISRDRSRENGH